MNLNGIKLDKDSPIPIAEQLANHISRLILNGELLPGEKLPAERDLALALGIARGTVKRSYTKLEQSKAIEIRKGSGSYVLTNGRVLELSQKREAAEILAATLHRLQGMGLSDKEILNLINLHVTTKDNISKINIMVVSNNYEILAELEKQLSYLTSTSLFSFTLSFLTFGNIQRNPEPVQTLMNYDLIIATSIDYPQLLEMVPMFRHKLVEATVSPRTNTLVELSAIPKDKKVRVIYRTKIFLGMVTKTLLSLGFSEENIFSCQEAFYNPQSHDEDGVGVVVNFNESPVFIGPRFEERNKAFLAQGGRLILFEYRIDRGSLTYIEDKIQEMLVGEA